MSSGRHVSCVRNMLSMSTLPRVVCACCVLLGACKKQRRLFTGSMPIITCACLMQSCVKERHLLQLGVAHMVL